MSRPLHRRLRAPAEDGAALIDPPLDQAVALIQKNRAIAVEFLKASGFAPALFDQARRLLLDPPRICVDPDTGIDSNRPIVMTGHQPALFHAGVWFKNFLSAAIARQANAWAVNLVVDNDLIRTPGIRVPTLSSDGPQIAEALFDAPLEELTWEKRYVSNPNIFREFAGEVRRLFQPLITRSEYQDGMVLDRLWPYAINSLDAQDKDFCEFAAELAKLCDSPAEGYSTFGMLSACLSAARRRLEADIGIPILDAAISEIAEQQPFHEFIRLLLSRYRELHTIHNTALQEYRFLNHVRSQSHPVPKLASSEQWLEVPLWISTFNNPRRRRAFVRPNSEYFELTDRDQATVSLSTRDSSDYGSNLIRNQIQLRPRALITTMYARLVLSDLFIHGIGGSKYDELTDLIIRRFFGIEPPAYITATATFRLPVEQPKVSLADVRASARRIRDLRYNPESLLREPLVKNETDLMQKLAALAAEKRAYLDSHDLRRCSPDVFHKLDSLNRAMHDLLQPVEHQLRAQHADLITLARQSQLLASREFSFVLFPAEKLPARLLDLCKLPA